MRVTRSSTATLGVGVALAMAAASLVPAGAAPAAPGAWKAKTLESNLKSPKALTLDGAGNVVMGQNAFGTPATAGKLLKYFTSGPKKGDLKRFGKKRSLVAIAHSPTGGYWTLRTSGVLYWQRSIGAKPKKVRDLHVFAANHPDPYNNPSDGSAAESNPFGLAVTPSGKAIVTDAAANSVVRVGPKGKTRLVARLATESVSTDHIPPGEGPPGLPPTILAEAVPTGVAVSPNGTIYVGELKGFPFRPGSSKIWKIKAGTTKAVCSVNPAIDGKKCKVAHRNLTAIASLALNPAGGKVVLEYAAGGVLAFESGCETGNCPDAVVVKLKNGNRSFIASGRFSAPGSIVAYGKGKFYVTDHMFTPNGGRLSRLRHV